MLHLVIAEIDKETRLPVRAFTDLEAAQAFLAKVEEHHGQRPTSLGNPDWEGQHAHWSAQHPARGLWLADHFYIDDEPVPLNNE